MLESKNSYLNTGWIFHFVSYIACSTCHSSWAPKCIGCHNEYDATELKAFDLLHRKYTKGQWREYVAEFSSSFPAMGVRENEEGSIIEPTIPGMIMTIDKGSFSGEKKGNNVSFHRLFAPNSPHTTTKEVRNCISCHANSESLGYGKGALIYEINSEKGKWVFTPEYENNENDGLPEDAWVPFLKKTEKDVINSTRKDFRPFTVQEQQQILLVGACLQCHKEDSKIMQKSLISGLKPLLELIKDDCVLPAWD